jgi:adducin
LKKKVLILKNHGAVSLGETVEEAWYLIYNLVIAAETQVKTMASGSYIMPPAKCIKQAYDVIQHGANNMDTGKDWEPYLFGEFEWETWMRDLDSRGFVTGHVYQDYPKKASHKSSH